MSNTPLQQTGGTFLGMVIGLVIGLAVALGVAVYVTKVPVPFIDRGVLSSPSEEKAEVEKNKDWNPNATFNQNSTASTVVPAPQASEPAPATESTPPAVSDAPAVAATPSDTPAKARPSSDPLGDLMQQKAASDTVAAPTPAPTRPAASAGQVSELVFFVQAGAYGKVQDAEAQRAKLAILGIDARVSSDQSNDQTVYRVRSGPFKTRAAALTTRQRLTEQNVESLVVAVPK